MDETLDQALQSLEIVGWLARSAPLWGIYPHRSLSKGSSRKEFESFWSS